MLLSSCDVIWVILGFDELTEMKRCGGGFSMEKMVKIFGLTVCCVVSHTFFFHWLGKMHCKTAYFLLEQMVVYGHPFFLGNMSGLGSFGIWTSCWIQLKVSLDVGTDLDKGGPGTMKAHSLIFLRIILL